MKPVPARQRRQAHRQRLALGRALHQVRRYRTVFWEKMGWGRHQRPPPWMRQPALTVPKLLRKHATLLRRTFAVLGS